LHAVDSVDKVGMDRYSRVYSIEYAIQYWLYTIVIYIRLA